MSDIPYLPPAGPPPEVGVVAPDGNREPSDIANTPLVDNNSVTGVVIDQNAVKLADRGPAPAPAPTKGNKAWDGDPLEDPDVMNHPGSIYASPPMDLIDPEGMELGPGADDPSTHPPDWAA